MIDVVSLGTFVFQPVVLFKLILFFIYWVALLEGVKVYYASRDISTAADEVAWWAFFLTTIVPSCGFCALLFAFSCSWLFGLFFLAIVCFAMLFHAFIQQTMLKVHESCENTVWERKLCGCLGIDWIRQSIVSMTWFANLDGDPSLVLAIFTSYIPLALSPFIVYGTWLAAYVYAHHSPEENMALVRHAYEFTFGCFTDGRFVLPSVSFDIQNIGAAFLQLAEAFRRLDKLGAVEYMKVSLACTLISFMLSIIKTLACVAGSALYALGKSGVVEPIPFWLMAPTQLNGYSDTGSVTVFKKYLRDLEEKKNESKLKRTSSFTSACVEMGVVRDKRGDSADRAPGTALDG